jgi:cysteine-S-conjugate beta-lyase
VPAVQICWFWSAGFSPASLYTRFAGECQWWLQSAASAARAAFHPALPGAPGHAIWKRDFTGACSLFGVEFRPEYSVESTHAFVEALELFGIGASWGGFESLALPTTGFVTRTASAAQFEGPLVRLHIGLEDVNDLIADLEQGLKVMQEFAG